MDPAGTFDFYYLFVEIIFGSILLSCVGVVVLMVVMGALMRMSPLLMIFLIGTYAFTFSIGYGGALFALIGFFGASWYMSSGILNYIKKVSSDY